MKNKDNIKTYSLEERMVEPFRSIRWLQVKTSTVFWSFLSLAVFTYFWWVKRNIALKIWSNELSSLIQAFGKPWKVTLGNWPNSENVMFKLPKVSAVIAAPSLETWWFFALFGIFVWWATGEIEKKYLPLRAILRFITFLNGVSLYCFAVSPLSFRHSIEEWSKIYFLGAYGSLIIYYIIWVFGVLWFPLPTRTKWSATLLLVGYQFFGIPLLLIVSVYCLQTLTLLLLPLFSLLIVPLTQLGWFVSFYSLALSAGSDPKKEVQLEFTR